MLEGRCPKCGYYVYGWALQDPRHQFCPACGLILDIKDIDNIDIQEKSYPENVKNKIEKLNP